MYFHLPCFPVDVAFHKYTIVMNISGANAMISLKNIVPPDIGSGQGHEIILRDIANKPSRNTGRTTSHEKRSDQFCVPSNMAV